MDEKLNVNVTAADLAAACAGQPFVLLTGDALSPKHPEAVKFGGILSAPADYLERKQGNWAPEKCHVRVDFEGMKIELYTNENTFNGDVITGGLRLSKALLKFQINTGELYGNHDLSALFRVNKFWFDSPEDHARIIAELNKFSAKVQTAIDAHKNNSGSTLNRFEQDVTGISWNRVFALNIPLFEGYPRVRIPVEIGIMPQGNAVKLFLESPEIYELIEGHKAQLIEAQIARFDAWGCSVVRTS